MRQRLLVIVTCFVLLALPVALSLLAIKRSTKLETRVHTIETATLMPCLRGQGPAADKACRALINRLLEAATPKQLKKLRGGEVHTAEEVRRIVQRALVRERMRQVLGSRGAGGGGDVSGGPQQGQPPG